MSNGNDFILFSVPAHLSINSSKDWQEATIRTYTTLSRFMKDNDLLVDIDPFDENGLLKFDTIVRASNVTGDGLEFYRKVVIGWYGYLDKSHMHNKYENISRLEKGLNKIRNKK